MRVIVGRGVNDITRHVFERSLDKREREQMSEDLKNFLFRPAMLARS